MEEALDGLRTAIFGESEVGSLEVGDHCAFFVAHGHWKRHLAGFHLEGQHGLIVGRLVGLLRLS